MGIEVRNVEVLQAAGRALRGADKQYRRELFRGLNRAAKPLREAVTESIPDYMPEGGGYAATLQGSYSPRTQVKTGGRDPSVRHIARTRGAKRATKALEAGRLTHPLFGNRDVWRTESIRPGFFSEPIRERSDDVRDEMVDAIGRVRDMILREIPG